MRRRKPLSRVAFLCMVSEFYLPLIPVVNAFDVEACRLLTLFLFVAILYLWSADSKEACVV